MKTQPYLCTTVRALVPRIIFVAFLPAFTTAQAVLAAEPEQPSLTEPPTMIISGSRIAVPASEVSQSIGVIGKSALEQDKPSTFGEIINRIPGVNWTDLGNEQHSMSIRQPISTNPVYQYLEDGIPIRPLGVFNHNALNELNMLGADSVEVVKGPASSLFGSNAVGGAVNLLTAAPSKTPSALFSARRNAVDNADRFDLNVSNTFDQLGIRLAHYSSRRGGANWQEYSDSEKDSTTLRADYSLGAGSTVRGTLVQTALDTAMTGALFENDYRTSPGKSLNTFTYRRDKAIRANLAWEGETLNNGLTTLTVFSRENQHDQLPSYTITGCGGATCRGTINSNQLSSLGFDLKHVQEFEWRQARLVSGLYVDRTENPYVSDNLSITRDPATGRYLSYAISNSTTPQGVRNYTTDIKNDAWFVQFEVNLTDTLRVNTGGRYDAITYDFTNHLSPAGSANFGAPNEERHFSRFSPKVGAIWSLSENDQLFTNLTQGFTAPEVSQLYGKSAIPNLVPSVYDSMELGLRSESANKEFKAQAAIYQLDGKNTIVNYLIAPGNSENRNAGSTRSEGLELGMQWAPGAWQVDWSSSWARHTYRQYQVSSTLDYSGKEQPQAPRQISQVNVQWTSANQWIFSAQAIHQSEYWMNNANSVQYEGHDLLNLRIQKNWKREWTAFVQLRNALDSRYAESASSSFSGVGAYAPNTQNQYTPGAPRALIIGIQYQPFAKQAKQLAPNS